MAKFYYNGVLLPEIPSDIDMAEYPYCFIRNNTTSGYYDLIFSKLIPLFNGDSSIGYANENTIGSGDTVWYRIEISIANDATEWVHNQTSNTWWGLDSARTVLWSSHDIYQVTNSIPTIYFEATELVPEIEEEISWYQIKRSTLESFGDEARRIDGGKITTPITTNMMLEIFRNSKPHGSLVGLENGYDVMFYDENNEGLAFYSIKQGHTINAPVYNTKAWKTTDGQLIVFPYAPDTDLILYAFTSKYTVALYEHFSVDKAIYPYVAMHVAGSNNKVMRIWFFKEVTEVTDSQFKTRGVLSQVIQTAEEIPIDENYLDSMFKVVLMCTPKLVLENSLTSNHNGVNGQKTIYTNYSVDGYDTILLLE